MIRPRGGMITSSTSEETILPNAAPMITPIARSSALPWIANFLNSFHMTPPPSGVRPRRRRRERVQASPTVVLNSRPDLDMHRGFRNCGRPFHRTTRRVRVQQRGARPGRFRRMDAKLLAACKAAFEATGPSLTLGAPEFGGACAPQPLVRVPLAMMNRHGLIAGATGTGKTKTLQLMAEQLSAAGVPVFLADMKGDLSGLGTAGETDQKIQQRAQETGWKWSPSP